MAKNSFDFKMRVVQAYLKEEQGHKQIIHRKYMEQDNLVDLLY
jgi:hypothetical protein